MFVEMWMTKNQVTVGEQATDRMLDDIWRSRHRVLHVVRLPLV